MKTSSVIRHTIELARAVRPARIPRPGGNGPYAATSAASPFLAPPAPSTPERIALKAALNDLAPDQLHALLVVMYLGRGDFSPAGLRDRYLQMRDTFPSPASAVRQMMEKAPLARYFRDGLNRLRASDVDIDALLPG